jgi:hypothetical protein
MTPRLAWVLVLALPACKDLEPLPPDDATPTVQLTAEATCEGFEAIGDSVRDRSTGLVWDRHVALTTTSYDEARMSCEAKGARLPTRQELAALRRPGSGDPCQLPACPFRGDRCATLACGTPVAGTDGHWGIAFSGGGEILLGVNEAEAVLCVR